MPGLERILRGIRRYEETLKPQLVEKFKQIKDNPEPKAVLFSCMDSRILLTRLMQAEPGDHFLVRNAGNLIPHHDKVNYQSMTTEPGALELGCVINDIRDVFVCGHSDCKAMNALFGMREDVTNQVAGGTPLQLWLKLHGESTVLKYNEFKKNGSDKPLEFLSKYLISHNLKESLWKNKGEADRYEAYIDPDNKFAEVDKFSMINTLQQLEHIASHPFLHERLSTNRVRLNALWFDVYTGDFYMFSRGKKTFVDVSQNFDHLCQDGE